MLHVVYFCHQAPERMAAVVSVLLKAQIVDMTTVDRLVSGARHFCIEESMHTEEACDIIFSRFRSKL